MDGGAGSPVTKFAQEPETRNPPRQDDMRSGFHVVIVGASAAKFVAHEDYVVMVSDVVRLRRGVYGERLATGSAALAVAEITLDLWTINAPLGTAGACDLRCAAQRRGRHSRSFAWPVRLAPGLISRYGQGFLGRLRLPGRP